MKFQSWKPALCDEGRASLTLTEAELRALMIASLGGDAGAYRLLLEDLQRRLRPYFIRRLCAGAHEADDLVQETLIAIHRRRQTYDRSQPVTAWVYGIARYKLIDHFRRLKRHPTSPLDDALELSMPDGSAGAEARHDIERALKSLPQRTQDLIRAVKLEEASHADAARRAGISEGAARIALHRGLKALTERIIGARSGS